MLHEIPIHLVVCARMDPLAVTDAALDRISLGGASTYPSAHNLLLSTRAEGSGTMLTTVLCSEERPAKRLLRVGDWDGIVPLVAVGHYDADRLPARLSSSAVEELASPRRFDRMASASQE